MKTFPEIDIFREKEESGIKRWFHSFIRNYSKIISIIKKISFGLIIIIWILVPFIFKNKNFIFEYSNWYYLPLVIGYIIFLIYGIIQFIPNLIRKIREDVFMVIVGFLSLCFFSSMLIFCGSDPYMPFDPKLMIILASNIFSKIFYIVSFGGALIFCLFVLLTVTVLIINKIKR